MHILHLVSHTHWDREWYLTFQQFRLKLVHLIDNLLALLDADPDYKHFMLDGQTIVLDDYLLMRPERAEIIRAHVQSGRLLIGPWHILPDEFLVSPEATIRNLLQGERTARQFGPKMMAGYVPDPFGHIGQLPQILRGFGIETAVFRRGLSDEPCELWWEAPDGSRIFTVYLRDGYGNAAELPNSDPARFVSEVCRLRDSLVPHSATQHILLMHGTDHMEPPLNTSAALAYANGRLEGDLLLHSTLPAYLAALQSAIQNPAERPAERGASTGASSQQSTLPTVRGELRSPKRHHLLPGVLSTRIWIKQRNHACETLLEKWAEPFSTWASWVAERGTQGTIGTPQITDPAPIVRQAWRLLMECHPHDSICGCSIDQVHDEMRSRFDQVEQIGEEITRQSLETLAAAIDTQSAIPHGRSAVDNQKSTIVVFNPVAGPRTDAVTAAIQLPAGMDEFEIVDESGNSLPHQVVGMGSREMAHPSLETTTVLFVARNVPGYGYRTFWVRPAATRRPSVSGLSSAIENEFLAVEVSPADGTLIVRDKRSGAVFRGLNRFVDGGDRGDEYNYCASAADVQIRAEVRAVRAEGGDARQSIEVSLIMQVPAALTAERDRQTRSPKKVPLAITTRATLVPGVPRVDILTEVDNIARDHRLRVHFPAPFAVTAADHDGHFEVVRRPVGLPAFDDSWVEQPRPEVPQRAFTDVSDGSIGLMIANRGLPEVEVVHAPEGSTEIALTLLRCVGWLSRDDFPARTGHAGPAIATPGAQMIGRHTFEYSIIPHAGGWQNAFRQAYAFNAPLRTTSAAAQPGRLPGTAAFVRAAPERFVVSALKAAEDGSGWIVRGYNIGPEEIGVTLTPWRRFAQSARVTLAEQVEAELTPDADGSVTFAVRGHEIVTVKFG